MATRKTSAWRGALGGLWGRRAGGYVTLAPAMSAVRDRVGGVPGHSAQAGRFEEMGWFGHSNGNTETVQSTAGGQGCKDQVQPGMDGPCGPTPTATLYLQKQDVQAGFLHPSILGGMRDS